MSIKFNEIKIIKKLTNPIGLFTKLFNPLINFKRSVKSSDKIPDILSQKIVNPTEILFDAFDMSSLSSLTLANCSTLNLLEDENSIKLHPINHPKFTKENRADLFVNKITRPPCLSSKVTEQYAVNLESNITRYLSDETLNIPSNFEQSQQYISDISFADSLNNKKNNNLRKPLVFDSMEINHYNITDIKPTSEENFRKEQILCKSKDHRKIKSRKQGSKRNISSVNNNLENCVKITRREINLCHGLKHFSNDYNINFNLQLGQNSVFILYGKLKGRLIGNNKVLSRNCVHL